VFSDQALKFVENDNVVFFKFDGIAGGQFKKGADNYAAEVDSLLRLILDIRKRGKGNITWINLTIGTWPSPYWLIYGDSIWKDGYDVGLAGWGNRRDMHITERDASWLSFFLLAAKPGDVRKPRLVADFSPCNSQLPVLQSKTSCWLSQLGFEMCESCVHRWLSAFYRIRLDVQRLLYMHSGTTDSNEPDFVSTRLSLSYDLCRIYDHVTLLMNTSPICEHVLDHQSGSSTSTFITVDALAFQRLEHQNWHTQPLAPDSAVLIRYRPRNKCDVGVHLGHIVTADVSPDGFCRRYRKTVSSQGERVVGSSSLVAVYQNVVQRSMLMPIANLMLHGILQSRANEAGYLLKESISDLKSFKTEVFTYFLSGVGLQELYIQPEELTDEHWRVVAEGAQFHRSFQSVLRQVQWIGGDPEQGQLYGWAACNDTAGVFGLRNPTTFQRKARVTLSSMWGVLGNSTWQISPLFESPAFPIESSVVLLDRELSLTVSPLGVLAYRASRISS
ncbi:hypothetical protein FOL47_009469, partial [Perkinsus chesapeaki]